MAPGAILNHQLFGTERVSVGKLIRTSKFCQTNKHAARWIKRIFARYGLGLCSIAATWHVICFSCQLKVSLMLFMAILIQLGRNCGPAIVSVIVIVAAAIVIV